MLLQILLINIIMQKWTWNVLVTEIEFYVNLN